MPKENGHQGKVSQQRYINQFMPAGPYLRTSNGTQWAPYNGILHPGGARYVNQDNAMPRESWNCLMHPPQYIEHGPAHMSPVYPVYGGPMESYAYQDEARDNLHSEMFKEQYGPPMYYAPSINYQKFADTGQSYPHMGAPFNTGVPIYNQAIEDNRSYYATDSNHEKCDDIGKYHPYLRSQLNMGKQVNGHRTFAANPPRPKPIKNNNQLMHMDWPLSMRPVPQVSHGVCPFAANSGETNAIENAEFAHFMEPYTGKRPTVSSASQTALHPFVSGATNVSKWVVPTSVSASEMDPMWNAFVPKEMGNDNHLREKIEHEVPKEHDSAPLQTRDASATSTRCSSPRDIEESESKSESDLESMTDQEFEHRKEELEKDIEKLQSDCDTWKQVVDHLKQLAANNGIDVEAETKKYFEHFRYHNSNVAP